MKNPLSHLTFAPRFFFEERISHKAPESHNFEEGSEIQVTRKKPESPDPEARPDKAIAAKPKLPGLDSLKNLKNLNLKDKAIKGLDFAKTLQNKVSEDVAQAKTIAEETTAKANETFEKAKTSATEGFDKAKAKTLAGIDLAQEAKSKTLNLAGAIKTPDLSTLGQGLRSAVTESALEPKEAKTEEPTTETAPTPSRIDRSVITEKKEISPSLRNQALDILAKRLANLGPNDNFVGMGTREIAFDENGGVRESGNQTAQLKPEILKAIRKALEGLPNIDRHLSSLIELKQDKRTANDAMKLNSLAREVGDDLRKKYSENPKLLATLPITGYAEADLK